MPDPSPATTSTPPPAARVNRRTPRWVAAAGAPFRRARQWFYYAPRAVQVALVVVLIGVTAAGLYFGTRFLTARAGAREIAAAQEEYDASARQADVPGMIAALDKVLAVSPGNDTATRRKAALEALSAAPDDPETAAVLMNVHLGQNRLAEADREAQKVLARHPSDWKAICVRAHYAVTRNDLAEARRLIDTLPPVDDPNARLDVSGLLYALRLYDTVGRDATSLRSLVVRRLLPHLKGAAAASAPAGVKAQLLEAYLEPFADPGAANELAGYWADISRLCETGVTEAAEAGDAALLIRFGTVGQRLRHQALPVIARQLNLPPEEVAARAKEVDDRTRRAWEKAREKAPDRYEPYVGLALTEPDPVKAVEILQDGLARCGNHITLLDLFTRMAAQVKNPVEAAQKALEAAKAAPTDPEKWFILARAAWVANRSDVAVMACREALRLKPDHVGARLVLATLLIDQGEGLDARDTLLALGPDFVFTNPAATQLYARGLVEGAGAVLVTEKFEEVLKRAPRNAPPVVPVHFLHGMLSARAKPDQAAEVAAIGVRLADKLRAEWPSDPVAVGARADALYHQAGLTDPPWNRDVCEAAVRAYADLPVAERDRPGVVVNTANLQLRGLGDEAAARRTLGRLHGAETTPLLTPAQKEVVAAVWVANNRPQDAVALLGPICVPPNEVRDAIRRAPDGTPGCWITLARAHLALRDREAAAVALARAENWPTPLAPRERYELSQVKSKLRSEQP